MAKSAKLEQIEFIQTEKEHNEILIKQCSQMYII